MSAFPSDITTKSTALVRCAPAMRSLSTVVQITSELTGRILLSILFLVSGAGKIGAYAEVADYMAAAGVPPVLLPLAIVTEIVGGLAIVLGWRTRIVAFLLAGYALLTAIFFHANLGDPIEAVMFFKNLSIAGGFLLLVAHGAGPLSLDRRRAK